MSQNDLALPARCDVVVIGGGPAGSSAACLLAREGFDVVLLDKVRHPRPAVGESVIPHFWKYADLLGVSKKIEDEGFIQKAGGITIWDGDIRQLSFANFGYTSRVGLHVERDRFDHILLQHAAESGARVFEEVMLERVDFSNPQAPVVAYLDRRGGTRSPGGLVCRFVVDASGPAAVLAKQFGTRRLVSSEHKYLGLWGYYENAHYIGVDRNSHAPECLTKVRPVTFVCSYEDGWIWHIILRKSTSVGLVINTDRIRGAGKEAQERYLQETCARVPYLQDLLAPATFIKGSTFFRPDYSYYSEKVCGEGFCCIGDAANFVDPIFSQGVVAAVYNAALCHWLITATFKNPRNRENYGRMCENLIKQYYGFSRLLAFGHFGGEGVDSDLVRALMKAMPRNELELALTASGSVHRAQNMYRMARETGQLEGFEDIVFDRSERLSELVFSGGC